MLNWNETLAKKFVTKWFWIYFFTILIGPMGYLIKIMISHDLSVSEVGMIYWVISFVTLLATFSDVWCTESLNYFLPKYIIKNEYNKAKYLLKITLLLQIISSVGIALIIFFIAPWLAQHYFNEPLITEILRIAWLYFIGINLFHITTVLFSVSQDTKLQKWSDFIKLATTAFWTGILLFTNNGNTETYMWAWIIGIIIWFLFALYFAYTKYYRKYFKWVITTSTIEDRNTFIRYALATLFTANIGVLLSQIDMQLIIVMLWSEATWYYSNYLSLLNIPFIFISPLFTFLFPVISELSSRKDSEKMKIIHREFSLYFSIIGIWISMFLFQFWEPLSVLFFNEKFRTSGEILWYSAFFLTLLILTQINFQFLAGTWKIWERAKILWITLPINIILNYIFIKQFGVHGSALAVGISWIPLWYMSYMAIREYSSRFNWVPFFKNIWYIIIASSILFSIIHTLHLSDITRGWAFSIIFIAMIINIAIFGIWNLSLLQNGWKIIKNNK